MLYNLDCKEEIRNLFLSENVKYGDLSPSISSVNDIIKKYEKVLSNFEKEELFNTSKFLINYIMHCKHCARPIDLILIDRLVGR